MSKHALRMSCYCPDCKVDRACHVSAARDTPRSHPLGYTLSPEMLRLGRRIYVETYDELHETCEQGLPFDRARHLEGLRRREAWKARTREGR
jgi:hypothetical protein